MIGGSDIVIEGATRADDADFIVRGLRSLWSNALIQPVTDLGAVPIRAFKFPIVAPVELLIYRDAESYASWQTDGATDSNQDAMVHVIVSRRSVTIVVGCSSHPDRLNRGSCFT
jgi:hypothetical protein